MTRCADDARDRLHAARAAIAASVVYDEPSATLGSVVLRPDQIETTRRVRAHLRDEGGCLLADDVGTGKTYVALAVARDWGRPLVVHPASLRSTWEQAARRANVRCDFVSHEGLSRGCAVAPTFDGVVVDESHRFRATSRRHARLAALTAHVPVLLLSATPLQNRARELAAQLALFLGEIAYVLPSDELARRVVRSAGSDEPHLPRVAPPRWLAIDADDGDVLRAILTLPPPPRAVDAGDGGVLLQLSLVRAWASSRGALIAAVRRRQRVLAAVEQCHQEGRRPTRQELGSWSGGGDVQLGFATLLASSVVDARERATLGLAIERERDGLDTLLRTIAGADDPDARRVAAITELRRAHDGDSILAFSESATTVRTYWSAMRGHNGVGLLTAGEARIASGRIAREALLSRFAPRAQGARSPEARERVTLLLATDLLSEGLNLQDASVVVHLDLPWNPARLAQRLGRIRRPGGAREVASYLLSPPAHAAMLLRTEARLRAKLARADATIGRSVDVLPVLGAPWLTASTAFDDGAMHERPEASLSAAELRGEIARLLARWRSEVGSVSLTTGGAEEMAMEAAVRADTQGWIALLDDGRLVASETATDCRAGLGEAPALVVRALRLLEGTACHADDVERDAAHRELNEWIVRDWTRHSSGLAITDSPTRRRMRRALADALRSAPRHRRGSIHDRVAFIRRMLARPLPLGLERALDAIADTRSGNADWLEEAANIVRRAPGCSRALASQPPRCRAMVVIRTPGLRFDGLGLDACDLPRRGVVAEHQAAYLETAMPHDADVGERLTDRVAKGFVARDEPLRLDVVRVDVLDVPGEQLVERDLLHVAATRARERGKLGCRESCDGDGHGGKATELERSVGLARVDETDRRALDALAKLIHHSLHHRPGAPAAPGAAPTHRAMRPFGPTAHPAEGVAKTTLLYAVESTLRHVAPLSTETSVPESPTATSVFARVPGTIATAER